VKLSDLFKTRSARAHEERIASLQLATAREKRLRAENAAKASIMRSIFGAQTQAQMSGLQNELFPSSEKSQGSLTRYSTLYASSNDRLRRLSRIALFESPAGAAMAGRLAETVVGSGLRLRAQPYWDIIDPSGRLSPEWRAEWVRNVEQRYRLWSNSYAPEYNTRRNLPQLSRAAFDYLLQDGEYFALLRYSNTSRANPLTIQLIPPENITGGHTNTPGHEVENGIEYDGYGQAIAYFIRDDKTGETTRIPRFGPKSGRIMMIHNFLTTNEKQRRGVPYFANCIEEFAKLGHFENLEIQAAIVNSLFAMVIEPPENSDGEPILSGGAIRTKSNTEQEQISIDPATDEWVNHAATIDFTKGGVIFDALPAGHTPHSFDTKRPNVNFGNFYDTVLKNLSSGRGMPLSAVQLHFNQSYSGARGELLMFWMAVTRFRENHGFDFEDDIYQMWFAGELSRGRIEAPGYYDSEEMRLAYTNAMWVGNRLPNMDPESLVKANILEHEHGYKTGEMITAETNGGDYYENLRTIKEEFDRLSEIKTPSTQSVTPSNTSQNRGS
jgi:lambda family phage portal protein